jgi:protein tyrosine phosphatase
MVDRFQNGETDVLICTFGVGSTGTYITVQHIESYSSCLTFLPRFISEFLKLSDKKIIMTENHGNP